VKPKNPPKTRRVKPPWQEPQNLLLIGGAVSVMGVGGLWIGSYFGRSTKVQRPVAVSSTTSPISPTSDFKNPPSLAPEVQTIIQTATAKSTQKIQTSPQLQSIVDEVVVKVTTTKLAKESLSISVIDLTTGDRAGYQDDQQRYPASIVKLFWAFNLYLAIDYKQLKSSAVIEQAAKTMVIDSDNEGASVVVDAISGTSSSPTELAGAVWTNWRNNRLKINSFAHQFFGDQQSSLNIVQKTFPIPSLKLDEPKGADQQLRIESTTAAKPIRNHVSTWQAVQAMNASCGSKLLSKESSNKLCDWLTRDLKNLQWKKAPAVPANDFNPIRGFMGEGVADQNVIIRSKAGWTKESRQEVALIQGQQDHPKFIVAVFANSKEYAEDGQVFPKVSQLLYQKLKKSKPTK
jgi:hypothetical protein